MENVSTSQFILNICIESIKYVLCLCVCAFGKRVEDARENHCSIIHLRTKQHVIASMRAREPFQLHHRDMCVCVCAHGDFIHEMLANKMNCNNFKFYINIE